jgi:hypothetical protein
MHSDHPIKTAFCTDYETLLFASQRALESWCLRREEVATLGFASKPTADELANLQTAFARAYSRLEAHKEHCELCRFVSRISARNRSGISVAALRKNPVA